MKSPASESGLTVKTIKGKKHVSNKKKKKPLKIKTATSGISLGFWAAF